MGGLPWTPFLTEQQQGPNNVAAQQADAKSVWSLYKFLIKQKADRAEFGIAGDYKAEFLAEGKLLKIVRSLGDKQSLMLLNLSADIMAAPADLVPAGLNVSYQEDETPELNAHQLKIWQN
jgi:hypothetical protein